MLRRVFSLAFTAALAAGTAAAQQPTSSATTTRAKGSPSAPVTVYEMSDFQCPYCRRFALETFPAIEKEYITPGKVRWVFVNYPLTSIHANAVAADTPAAPARSGVQPKRALTSRSPGTRSTTIRPRPASVRWARGSPSTSTRHPGKSNW